MNSVQLREQRAAINKQAQKILEKAEAENRDLTAEEDQEYERHWGDIDKLEIRIGRMEKQEAKNAEIEEPMERTGSPIGAHAEMRTEAEQRALEHKEREEWRGWIQTGHVTAELRNFQARRKAETRDTVISTDAKGGYLIAPTQVTNDLVKVIQDEVFIRGLATVRQVTEAKKLGIRKLTTHMADADWTTEVAAVTEDTTMAFDRRDLEPYLFSKLAKVSIRTLELSADAEQIIRDELGYKFGITEEKAFLTGNGSSKPLGIFTANAAGISTARDVAAASATAVVGDDLVNLKYSLKQSYMRGPGLAWVLHRDLVKMIRKLKASGTGEYIWQPGLAAGDPDRILDIPFYMSEYAPNTFTTGLYVAVLGNLKYYTIAEVNTLFIQRLVERYADTNEVGFIGRRWVDGAPILEEAFARLKLA
jgi:HK97 family phage major capsid protein